jgi:hypothetical protein
VHQTSLPKHCEDFAKYLLESAATLNAETKAWRYAVGLDMGTQLLVSSEYEQQL